MLDHFLRDRSMSQYRMTEYIQQPPAQTRLALQYFLVEA